MTEIRNDEMGILELTRKHIRGEREIIACQTEGKVEPIDESTLLKMMAENYLLGNKIRVLCSEYKSIQIHDRQVRNQLIKLRNEETIAQKKIMGGIKDGYYTYVLEKDESIGDYSSCTLDDMIESLTEMAGYSGDFEDRKIDFGPLFNEKKLPPNLGTFLWLTKNFFLLNMHEAVIAFSRLLIEIACVSIYDNLPKEDKSKTVSYDKDVRILAKIRWACNHRLKSNGLTRKEISNIREKAENNYKKASEILHGKITEPVTAKTSLSFIQEVFSIIEALY